MVILFTVIWGKSILNYLLRNNRLEIRKTAAIIQDEANAVIEELCKIGVFFVRIYK